MRTARARRARLYTSVLSMVLAVLVAGWPTLGWSPGARAASAALAGKSPGAFVSAVDAASTTLDIARNSSVADSGSETNTAPVATADQYWAWPGSADVTMTVAAPGVLRNDRDAERDALTAALEAGPEHGTLVLEEDGSFTFTTGPAWPGEGFFTYRASDGVDVSAPATVTITSAPLQAEVAGASRYETAVEASKLAYPDGAETVVIATGRNWPDALGGASLAGVLDGPILLTDSDATPQPVVAEIARLGASSAVILGGEGAVGAAVESALEAALGAGNVERIAGTDRYQTAERIAERVIELLDNAHDGTALVATGGAFPDALAAAPLAAAKGWPLFLAHPAAGLSDASKAAMAEMSKLLILGGPSVVSAETESYLKTTFGEANVTRLAGPSRYDTAALVADYGVRSAGLSWNRVGITTGQKFPDALAGGVLQGKMLSVMLLTRPDSIPGATRAAMGAPECRYVSLTFYGGTDVVSETVRSTALGIVRGERDPWTEIIAIAAGGFHTVVLGAEGTVLAIGDNREGQCDVTDWTGITEIAAGVDHTVGLKSDGTAVAVGFDNYGQCSGVSGWTGLTAIAAGLRHTVGLKSDGTAVAVGAVAWGACDVSGWTDIAAVAADYDHTVGLKNDGTVVAVGDNRYGQCDVSTWTEVAAVAAGAWHTVGVKSDGSVAAAGWNEFGQGDVSDWNDITAVAAGFSHTVGLKSDGTVVAVGDDRSGQCAVSTWTDIIAVAAGDAHTVGLKSDGTVVAVGDDRSGQCAVSTWTGITRCAFRQQGRHLHRHLLRR